MGVWIHSFAVCMISTHIFPQTSESIQSQCRDWQISYPRHVNKHVSYRCTCNCRVHVSYRCTYTCRGHLSYRCTRTCRVHVSYWYTRTYKVHSVLSVHTHLQSTCVLSVNIHLQNTYVSYRCTCTCRVHVSYRCTRTCRLHMCLIGAHAPADFPLTYLHMFTSNLFNKVLSLSMYNKASQC
jgi:hypothetical protein